MASALEGIRVLELCSFVAGPYCAKLLADMGADVVKVEHPRTGDEARRRGPFYNGQTGSDASLLFIYINSNKRGTTLDISLPTGRSMMLDLLKQADLLVEDLSSGEAERLGLGYLTLQESNPGLVVASVTPFGRSGPHKDYRAHYMNTYHSGGDGYMLPAGRLVDELYQGGEPIKAGGYLGEYQAGLSAALASMAALVGRLVDGRGQHVDVSKQETLINLNSADFCKYPDRGFMEGRQNRHLSHYIGGLYRCKDGFWELLIPSQRHWEAMLEVMGQPAWATDEKFSTQEASVAHRQEVDEKIEEWAMNYTKEEIYHSLQGQGCAAGPVYSTREVLQDPQMGHRDFFAEMEHPVAGTFKAPSAPYKLSSTPWAVRRPAPSLGQHNKEIYGDWLGYDAGKLARLRQMGVI